MAVGIDLVHVPTFAAQLDIPGSRFASVFAPLELRIASTKPQRAAHLAGRWAAKEAFVKAWSARHYGQPPLIRPEEVLWHEIVVQPDRWQRPQLHLYGEVAARSGVSTAQVSISHDGDYATAICLL